MRSRGNDRDAYTLIAGKLAIINACTISRSVFPKFVLTSDSSQSNLGTISARVFLPAELRCACCSAFLGIYKGSQIAREPFKG